MERKTVLVEDFSGINFSRYIVPLITVYKNPKDFPGKYVARLFNLDKPTETAIVKNTLEEIRSKIPYYMVRLERYRADDPVILETWV